MKRFHLFTVVPAVFALILVGIALSSQLMYSEASYNLSSVGSDAIAPVAFKLAYSPDPRSNGDDYPITLASAPSHSFTDAFGMQNRSCSSYALWKVDESYGYVPNMDGNNWPALATAQHIPTSSSPVVGSVAYAAPNTVFGSYTANQLTTTYSAGDTGHVMWVNSVNPDGTITVSEYNLSGDGDYHVETFVPKNMTYIEFGSKR